MVLYAQSNPRCHHLPYRFWSGSRRTRELGKSLRADGLSVAGSRRYREFDDYLLPAQTYAAMRTAGLPLPIEIDSEKYLTQCIELLHAEFQRVDRFAQTNELPGASVTDGVLKITPLYNQELDEAELLTRQAYGLMPRIKITDLLTEVDSWCLWAVLHEPALRGRRV